MTAADAHTDLKTFSFGDSPALADRLASLVLAGVKIATCSAAAHGVDTQIGERQVCLSGDGTPVCVIETTDMLTLKFADVTPDLAALEGEGDLSHRYWADAHTAYYKREGTWAPDMDVIFETFRVTDILDLAFAEGAGAHLIAERREAYENGYTALGDGT